MMDDRIRISDADRERAAAQLREHFAEGRLSSEELDERIAAALSAKTFGELRRTLADLPEPAMEPRQAGPAAAPWAGRPAPVFRRGPRLFPLVVLALVAALVIPGAGWLLFAFFQLILALWLVAAVAGIIAMTRFRRHLRRHWESGGGPQWRQYQWHG
jgi:hypothetical protein